MLYRILLLTTLLGLAGFDPLEAGLADDLLAHYSFNGHTNDISGNANHGTPMNGFQFTTDRFGNQAAAGEFNGLDSYVIIPNSPSLSTPDTACTQAAWISLYGTSLIGQAFGPVIMKSASSPNAFMYRMTAQPAGIGVAFNDWTTAMSVPAPMDLNQWYHVATVFEADSVIYYLDGLPVGSTPMNLTINQDMLDLTIGADFPGILEIFNGKMDDVRIYSRALSPAEIAQLAGVTTGIADTPTRLPLPLGPVYPNPFSRHAKIDFVLDSEESVHFWVYDAAGRRIRSLAPGVFPGGAHTVIWDGHDDLGRSAPAGIYFMRVRAGDQESSRRIVRVP